MELKVGKRTLLTMTRGTMRAADPPEKPSLTKEVGATGTAIFARQLYEEEYNADLRGDAAIKAYERMRKSDGQVKAALLACKLPLLVARWDIMPASKDPQDIEIAGIVKDALFDGMTITWDAFLRQALLMLDFGFSPFEKVWELRDGLYKWRKLAPRLPKSIARWWFDRGNELEWLEQQAYKDDQYQTIYIPAAKAVIFTHEMEGSDPRGTSLLRAAYKHHWYKNTLYAIDGIAAERHGVGMAHFTYPDNATAEQKNAIEEMGMRLHTHERQFMATPASIGFDLKGVSGQLHDTKGSIEHHDVQIVRSVLAQFINVGAKEVGSYALSNDQSRFFLFALQAVGRNVCDTLNREVIKEMVDYNWAVKAYPKLTVSGLDNPEITAYATAMASLASSGMIRPDDDTEAELRRTLKLPQRQVEAPAPVGDLPEQPEQPSDAPESTSEASDPNLAPVPPAQQATEPGRFWRAPQGHELTMALDDIDDKLKSMEERFVEAVKPIQDRQIESLVKTVSGYMEDKQFDRLGEIDVPFRNKVAEAIDDLLLELFDFGKEQVKSEGTKQGRVAKAQDEEGDEDIEKPEPDHFLHVRSLAIANLLANRLRSSMSFEALRQTRLGVVNPDVMAQTLGGLSDQELTKTAQYSTAEAFNLGRAEQAQADADDIDRVQSSAILDENTCEFCRGEDGKEWKKGEEPAAPPYRECEGHDRCRCVHVYIYKGEVS
jgi:hypothetical protein